MSINLMHKINGESAKKLRQPQIHFDEQQAKANNSHALPHLRMLNTLLPVSCVSVPMCSGESACERISNAFSFASYHKRCVKYCLESIFDMKLHS